MRLPARPQSGNTGGATVYALPRAGASRGPWLHQRRPAVSRLARLLAAATRVFGRARSIASRPIDAPGRETLLGDFWSLLSAPAPVLLHVIVGGLERKLQ